MLSFSYINPTKIKKDKKMLQTIQISAFKTAKKTELYLFVIKKNNRQVSLEELPNELLVMVGKPVHIFDFELTENKILPRSESKEIISSLADKGYYIQMPPTENEKIGSMSASPERIDNIF